MLSLTLSTLLIFKHSKKFKTKQRVRENVKELSCVHAPEKKTQLFPGKLKCNHHTIADCLYLGPTLVLPREDVNEAGSVLIQFNRREYTGQLDKPFEPTNSEITLKMINFTACFCR
jgi:hypothetical protein